MVLLRQVGVLVANDLTHSLLSCFLRWKLVIEQAILDGASVLNEGSQNLVEVLTADSGCFVTLGFDEPIYLNLNTASRRVHANIATTMIVSVSSVVQPRLRSARNVGAVRYVGWRLWTELETRCEHLFHQQTSGDRFECVVDRLGNSLLTCVRLGDQVSESGLCLADSIACRSTNDLHDFSQATAVTDGQGMFAPNPIETLFGHPQGDNDVNMISILATYWITKRRCNLLAFDRFIVHEIRNSQSSSCRRFHKLKTGGVIGAQPLT